MQHSVDEFEIKRNNHLLSITKKRVVRIIAIFLIWALVITYMILPVSKMKGIKVTGNVYLTNSKVIEIAHIDTRTFRWDFDEDVAEDLLNNYQFDQYKIIKSAKIHNNIVSVKIDVKEIFPLGVINNNVVFSNGNKIPMVSYLANTPQYYIDAVGTLPELIINELSPDSYNDFVTYSSKVSSDYIKLIQEKNLVKIENIEVPASPEDEVYKFTFEEQKNETTFIFNVLVSPSRIATKLTYDYYESKTTEAMNRALLDGSYDGTIIVNVDFIGSWNVVEIIKE